MIEVLKTTKWKFYNGKIFGNSMNKLSRLDRTDYKIIIMKGCQNKLFWMKYRNTKWGGWATQRLPHNGKHFIRVRENEAEAILDKIMDENFSKLMKDTNIPIQEYQKITSRTNPKEKSTLRCIISKLQKVYRLKQNHKKRLRQDNLLSRNSG